jgi:hypothetical protein
LAVELARQLTRRLQIRWQKCRRTIDRQRVSTTSGRAYPRDADRSDEHGGDRLDQTKAAGSSRRTGQLGAAVTTAPIGSARRRAVQGRFARPPAGRGRWPWIPLTPAMGRRRALSLSRCRAAIGVKEEVSSLRALARRHWDGRHSRRRSSNQPIAFGAYHRNCAFAAASRLAAVEAKFCCIVRANPVIAMSAVITCWIS